MDMAKLINDFSHRVLEVVRRIPRGQTLSYQEVARRAGSARAYRAVGTVLRTYDAKAISAPCHRVIHKDGTVGNYRWGREKKIALLKKEGAL